MAALKTLLYIIYLVLVLLIGIICDNINPEVVFKMLSPEKFDSVKSRVIDVISCKGPKLKNCTDFNMRSNDDFSNVTFVVRNKQTYEITKAKLQVSTFKKNKESPKIVKSVDHPCSHFFFGSILRNLLNLSKECVISKGSFKLSVDIRSLSTSFLVTNLPQGLYESKTTLLGKECNVVCIIVKYSIES